MPEILPSADDAGVRVSPPKPGTVLFFDGTTWHVPRVDDDGRVQVRGEDQLFSFKGVLSDQVSVVISGADGDAYSNPVPDGEVWVVTTAAVTDTTTAPSRIRIGHAHDGTVCVMSDQIKVWVAGEYATWSGHVYLDKDDRIRGRFIGGLVNDVCYVHITGCIMTPET